MRSRERTFRALYARAMRRGGWYFQHQGEAGEAAAQRDGEVGERVYRKVFAHGMGGDWGPPVQREVI